MQFLLEGLLETGLELFLSGLDYRGNPDKPRPILAFIVYSGLGAILGAASLFFLPELFIRDRSAQWANLLVTPPLVGFAAVGVGKLRRAKGKAARRGHRFINATAFALSSAAVRLAWGS